MYWLIIVATVGVAATVLWFTRRAKRKIPAKSDLDAEMVSLAELVIRRAKETYGVDLDYTETSIGQVELILGQLHAKYRSSPFSEELLTGFAQGWGAYVGEVIRRRKPAHWQRNSLVAAGQTFPLVFDGGGECYPLVWCYKRIKEGPEEDIAFKCKFFLEALPKPGKLISRTEVNGVTIDVHSFE